MMIENYKEAITKLMEIFDNGYTFKNLNEKEILEVLKDKKILNDFITMFASEIYNSTKEKEKITRENIIKQHPNLDILKNYENIDKLIGYLYYEYDVTEEQFLKLIDNIIGENNRALKDKLINDKIIYINENNSVKLTQDVGFQLAIALGYSVDDLSKEKFVQKVKISL